jgi:large conductance mechanosensitive channel
MMGMLKEFKEFAMRGNVVDLAVGIVIGGAFGKIVTSLVNDLIMPPVGMLIGGVDFSSLAFTLKPAEGEHAAVVIRYGTFANTVVDFVIVAFAIFLVVKVMNRLQPKQKAAAAATTKLCPECQTNIPLKAKRCPHCTSDIAV